MSNILELQTLCSTHEVNISSACFYKGCKQALLCRKCYKDHVDDHDSEIKDIVDLIDDNGWVEAIERHKNVEIAQLEGIYHLKKNIQEENEQFVNEFIQSIITSLEAQKETWLRELDELVSFSDQQERELDGGLAFFANLDFTGDVFEKINKVKNFQDNILRNARQLIETLQCHLGKAQVDKGKLEDYKVELTGVIQRLSFKHFLVYEPFKSLTFSEERATLEEEYKEFQNYTNTQLEGLKNKIEDPRRENAKLKSQLDEAIEAKGHLENDYEKEVATLKNKITALENLKNSIGFEDSKIIQAEGFTKLKEWIPKPLPSTMTELKLIYRASRDGWSAQDFHTKCDGITPTISVIKSKGYERVFGDFTTKSWGSNNGCVKDQDAFIFSLTHGEKYACKDPSKAIYAGSQSNIVFGYGYGGDICLEGNCDIEPRSAHCNFPSSYECSRFPKCNPDSQVHLAGNKNFKVKELEVYQILYL